MSHDRGEEQKPARHLALLHDARDSLLRHGHRAGTRWLFFLAQAHDLIERVDGTHRYLVTDRGRTAIAAVIAAQRASLAKLQQCAA